MKTIKNGVGPKGEHQSSFDVNEDHSVTCHVVTRKKGFMRLASTVFFVSHGLNKAEAYSEISYYPYVKTEEVFKLHDVITTTMSGKVTSETDIYNAICDIVLNLTKEDKVSKHVDKFRASGFEKTYLSTLEI